MLGRSLRIDFRPFVWGLLGWAVLATGGPAFGQNAAETPDRWEATIKAFETQDAAEPPPKGANLFVGSSSIRLWKLADSFPDRTCINRGFGGSQLHDVARYADRLVLPHRPKVIVLYAGDNDLAAKRTPEQVRDDYVAFVAKIRPALPEAKLVWVAIKPSLKRWALKDAGLKANELVREAQKSDRHSVYVDVWQPMLGADGLPRSELFVKDGLHLSPAGYEIWAALVRPHLE
jgi:lysophospholipase L1-like esterase